MGMDIEVLECSFMMRVMTICMKFSLSLVTDHYRQSSNEDKLYSTVGTSVLL